MAKTLKIKTSVLQIRENERKRAMLIGIRIPVQTVVRRRKSIAPSRAAASAAMTEIIAPVSEATVLILVVDEENKGRGYGGKVRSGLMNLLLVRLI